MLLVYGAYGYTGALVAQAAGAHGLRPILAGRDPRRLAAVAEPLGLEARAFALDDPRTLDQGLDGVTVVLHCAGPFIRTAAPMVSACLRTGTHYLDVTGEIPVFESVAARDGEARERGVLLLPGAGFDVVPSDCLAAHLARRLPGATALTLGLYTRGGISHGTATTMLLHAREGGAVRRGGRITRVPTGSGWRRIDFQGDGRTRLAVRIPWGDVSTAWHSTGIPDIDVHLATKLPLALGMRTLGAAKGLLGVDAVRSALQRRIDRAPAGPTEAQRARGACFLWGEVRDGAGQRAVSRLRTPDGYTHTVDAALAIAARVLAGDAPTGFQTPSRAFGPDFVLDLPGVTRTDG